MMIKSALMTSAADVIDASTSEREPGLIFRQGAGHVVPNRAADPGLVYDSNANDWLAFLCGKTTGVSPATCSALVAAGYSLDASDLNARVDRHRRPGGRADDQAEGDERRRRARRPITRR